MFQKIARIQGIAWDVVKVYSQFKVIIFIARYAFRIPLNYKQASYKLLGFVLCIFLRAIFCLVLAKQFIYIYFVENIRFKNDYAFTNNP